MWRLFFITKLQMSANKRTAEWTQAGCTPPECTPAICSDVAHFDTPSTPLIPCTFWQRYHTPPDPFGVFPLSLRGGIVAQPLAADILLAVAACCDPTAGGGHSGGVHSAGGYTPLWRVCQFEAKCRDAACCVRTQRVANVLAAFILLADASLCDPLRLPL